ncbi:C1q tumor necrosis factor-related 1 [Podarcis lilfordi]|nr:C1q tumor necrosis factor-related 1 [Podarcis lilfordi]
MKITLTPSALLLICLIIQAYCNEKDAEQRPGAATQPPPPQHHTSRPENHHEKYSKRPRGAECVRCCDPPERVSAYPMYQPMPQINVTILKVGRRKPLHSNDYYQTLVFDTEYVNLYGHFNMFMGKFYCYVPGIYFFSLNVHTWNQKETYLHIMHNGAEAAILYAQASDRSIMQSQSLMLELQDQDEIWVRLFKGERDNAVFSDEYDTYVIFSGYLIKPNSDP